MKFLNNIPQEFYLFLIVVLFIVIIVLKNPDHFDREL